MQRYRITPDVRFRSFPPEWVVLKQSSGEVLVVNELGGRVLEVLRAGDASEAEVVQTLLPEYEVTPTVLTADVSRFLQQLRDALVIEPA